MIPRTDLALESCELWRQSAGDTSSLSGVFAKEEQRGAFKLTTVEILNETGSMALCKPIGKYLTLELDALIRREQNAFQQAVETFSALLKEMLNLEQGESVLIVGLGNREITPDAVGPETAEHILVTRHLRNQLPEQFFEMREVSALSAGVLGVTGIESADLVRSLCSLLHPARILAVDALAAARSSRLCRTVQISDAGIIPGSGVGNSRNAIDFESLGIPVVSIGVPTVVEGSALVEELAMQAGLPVPDEAAGYFPRLIVTPKDIDHSVRDLSKFLAYGINLALHDDLSIEDVDMLIG